ncbi:MAG: arsenite methyltransferase [Nitrososphaeraceae archaeon]|nr:arsenite methyltransferase [Nitrososphaeraceae archaeon]
MQKEILKKEIEKNYGKIALEDNTISCTPTPGVCCDINNISKDQASIIIGYNETELKSIPKESILGLGCGTPLQFADLNRGETVVDLGAGAGIDVFLSSKMIGDEGRVIGIDMTDEMLEKARKSAIKNNYKNVEFRKGDIEDRIPIEDNSADVVISNCVINLTSNKTNAFKEVYRILKKGSKGRMIISDLITTKEISKDNINTNNWCSCIDGALTKENYLKTIKDAGFQNIKILNEKIYMDESNFSDGRKITSITVRAITN